MSAKDVAMSSQIPILDLKAQYTPLREEILEAVKGVLDSQYFILGPEVKALEEEIGKVTGCAYAVGVSSGTDALLASLMALDIGPGDEVITTPFTFFATIGVIVRRGAKPIFADVDERDFNILPEEIAKKITSKTKAILPVHLYGQCADITQIASLVGDIPIIEDAAQAIGASHHGKGAGSLGKVGCFSFYPSKNLGGVAEGGICTTNSKDVYDLLCLLRNHGSPGAYRHEYIGGNFRLCAINGAVLRIKLRHLESWNVRRRENASLYEKLFQETGLVESGEVIPPLTREGNVHVFHQYVIRVQNREGLQKYLQEKGISTVVYYPLSLHLQKCLDDFGYKKGDFPVSERLTEEVLALPIYQELTPEQIQRVVGEIENFYKK